MTASHDKLLGPSIRRLLSEEYLVDLQTCLGREDANLALQVVSYMRALRELYRICVAKDLDPNWATYIDNYKVNFKVMFDELSLPWTLKQHIICDHLGEWFTSQNVTLRATSGEYIESCHSALRY